MILQEQCDGVPKIKAIKKEQKLYLWDWSQASSLGERFENLVVNHLLKYCHYQQDVHGEEYELWCITFFKLLKPAKN